MKQGLHHFKGSFSLTIRITDKIAQTGGKKDIKVDYRVYIFAVTENVGLNFSISYLRLFFRSGQQVMQCRIQRVLDGVHRFGRSNFVPKLMRNNYEKSHLFKSQTVESSLQLYLNIVLFHLVFTSYHELVSPVHFIHCHGF